ncbi:MAG: glycyl-radical enzyme activating protein [Spirochaetes bacterium]|nr:glycyl-radical enzyme activating protein [Spirochaetota bacterium]
MNTKPSSEKIERAIISNIQRFSLHDGPGIRTTVFLKGCPLRCLWCQNPETLSARPEVAFRHKRCIGCGACLAACRYDAIIQGEDRRVDYSRCTGCGDCVKVCPGGALSLIGEEWLTEELAAELAMDKDFFRESGGGVTFSGGEPLMHPAFLRSVCGLLRGRGISVTVETCGFFDRSHVDMLAQHADVIYYDLKHMDPEKHRELTGRDNGRILENFSALAVVHGGLQPRIPVIPGMNDDNENIRRCASFILSNGIRSIHCLPYNPLGRDKLRWINTDQRPLEIKAQGTDRMEELKSLFQKEGVDAIVYS